MTMPLGWSSSHLRSSVTFLIRKVFLVHLWHDPREILNRFSYNLVLYHVSFQLLVHKLHPKFLSMLYHGFFVQLSFLGFILDGSGLENVEK